MQLGIIGHSPCLYALSIAFLDARLHALVQSVIRIHGVQRVVYVHPSYRKIALLPEGLIAEHLTADVTELYVEAQPVAQKARNLMQHSFEHQRLLTLISIYALAVNMSLMIHKRRQQHEAAAA